MTPQRVEEFCFTDNEFSRRHFLALLLQFVVLVNLPACKKSTPAFDGSITLAPFVAEDHSRFLSHWAEAGFRDTVLINFDAHDDIIRIPDQKIAQLKEIYNQREWQRFAASDNSTSDQNGLFGIANWIYAGGKLGLFREVYWVVPYQLSGLKESELKQLLSGICFDPEDVATFTLKDNLLKGYVNGIPFALCSLDALPVIKKPLLLSFDVDFFPSYSTAYKISFLPAIFKFFTSIYAQKYNVLDAAVCFSINGEYLQPRLRWVGNAVAHLLKNPQELRNASPTDLLNLQQYLENAYRSIDADDILKQTDRYLNHNPDPSILVYRAFAYSLKGDVENAHRLALEACNQDKLYCSALSEIGSIYYRNNQFQIAERFYKSALSIDPEMKVGLFEYGICLQKIGKLKEALRLYEKDIKQNGEFPTEFLIVDLFIKLGDRPLAESSLEKSLKSLATARRPLVQNRTLADAMYSILEYCEKNGLNKMLLELRQHPMIQKMFNDFPKR